MSFTDNRYIFKGTYNSGTIVNSNFNRAHFVRITAGASEVTVTLKDKDSIQTLGTVLIYSTGETIIVEKKPEETISTDKTVYASGETGVLGGGGADNDSSEITNAVSDAATTLQTWYDGSDIEYLVPSGLSDGTGITQWQDQSAFAHNANATGGATTRPAYRLNQINSLSAIDFDGLNDCLSINPVAWMQNLTGMSVMMVVKQDDLTGQQSFIISDQDDIGIKQNGTSVSVFMNGASATTGVTSNTTGAHVHTLVFDGTQTGNADRLKYRFDGSDATLGFTGTVPATISPSSGAIYVGCDDDTEILDGKIGEILIFNKALSSAEITDLEAYLTSKWGI